MPAEEYLHKRTEAYHQSTVFQLDVVFANANVLMLKDNCSLERPFTMIVTQHVSFHEKHGYSYAVLNFSR